MGERYNVDEIKDFTQKDLLKHLLNVAQHSATREELENKFEKLDHKIDNINNKIDSAVDRLDDKIDAVAKELNDKIDAVADRLNSKIDGNTRWILATIISMTGVMIAAIKLL